MAERVAMIKMAKDVDKGKLCLYSRMYVYKKPMTMLRVEAQKEKVSFLSTLKMTR
jgi:hypothetical protein